MGYGALLTATGSYSKANGQALATGAGLVPVPVPSPILPSNLVSLFGGNSYSFGLSSTPAKRLIVTAAYAKSISNTSSDANRVREPEQSIQFPYPVSVPQAELHQRILPAGAGLQRVRHATGSYIIVLHRGIALVQLLLTRERRQCLGAALIVAGVALLLGSDLGIPKIQARGAAPELWEMSLDGGRKLTWERSFNSESEVKPNRGFWNKLVDVIAGAPDYRFLVRPYSIATDSRGRIIVTDPGAQGVHIFDFTQHKYKFIERQGKARTRC